jgi:crotonobetainyl-CoA:carnitine CoA-transferase CaiB-like acyl-CoA transferase
MSIKDLLIVEIAEGVAGPCCALQYADLGARVIKIESPVGDRTREWGPPMTGDDAAIFAHLNRGKESVMLDLTRDDDRAKLDAILARADAVVAQNDPGEDGLPDWRAVARAHPQLVVCEIDDFGAAGPLSGFPGSELTVQAMSGFTRYVGDPGGAPCRVGFEIAGMAAAMNAYQAIAAGIWHRKRSGSAQYVRVSALNSLLSMKTILLIAQGGDVDEWKGFHLNGPHWPADTGWPTRDGQVTFDFRADQYDDWVAFCAKMGLGHLKDHPDYKDWRSTVHTGDRRFVYGEPYRQVFATMTSDEVNAAVNDAGGTSLKYHTYGEVLAHPQVQILDPLVDVPDESPGARQQVGSPFRYVAEPRTTQYARAPRLGEHTDAVLAEFAAAPAGRRRAAAGGGA